MAEPLDERIMAVVEDKLETSGPTFSYAEDLEVHRPPAADQALGVDECPAISIRRPEKTPRAHIRDAEEFILTVTLICTAEALEDLRVLMLYARKVVQANPRWNDGDEDLAQRTWPIDESLHETEVEEGTVSGSITFRILARADLSDLTQVKAI